MTRRYLELTTKDKKGLADLAGRLEPHLERMVQELSTALEGAEELAGSLPDGKLPDLLRPELAKFLTALKQDRVDDYLRESSEQMRQQAGTEASFEGLVVAVMAFKDIVSQLAPEIFANDTTALAEMQPWRKLFHVQIVLAAKAYQAGKEDTIRAQQEMMLTLSTPVVEVWHGVLALPLVGTIDTGRARQITHSLLNAIRETQARIVILDISGVPLVDTRVANHLIKTIQAARLLGTRGILVGISPEIADTLINLDLRFDGIETYFSLRQGLEAALAALGLTVSDREVRR